MTEKSKLILPDINELVKADAPTKPMVRLLPEMPEALRYDDIHPTMAGERALFEAPYIYSLDTRRMTVSDGQSAMKVRDLSLFKSVLVNTLEDHVGAYASSIWVLVQVCADIQARKRSGNQIVNSQLAMNLIGAAERSLIATHERLAAWDGSTSFQVILPYSVVATYKENTPLHKAGDVDTDNSKLRIMGSLFEAKFS